MLFVTDIRGLEKRENPSHECPIQRMTTLKESQLRNSNRPPASGEDWLSPSFAWSPLGTHVEIGVWSIGLNVVSHVGETTAAEVDDPTEMSRPT